MALLKTYPLSFITSGVLDTSKLHQEILDSTFVDQFSYVNFFGDNIEIHGQAILNEAALDNLLANHDNSTPERLRIQSLLLNELTDLEVKQTDVCLLGMTQEAWDYSRGARTTRDYKNGADLVVQHVYTYTMTNGNRDVATITHTFNWYQEDGNIGLSKVTNKTMTAKALGELNREVRIGRMMDLRENAKLIGRQDITDNLYSWYEVEIEHYEHLGTLEFEDAIKNETDTARRAVLDESIPAFGNLTVEQLLIWQFIGAYSWP